MPLPALQEVVLSGGGDDSTMNMWELITATTIVSYRPASPASKDAVATVGRDFFAVPLANKPTLHVFNWRKDQPHAKMSLPEKVCSIAANADGSYILAGAETGRVYLWEVCGGALIRTWEAHYRSVTSIAFTDDSSFILTASEDALVRAWSMGNLLDYSAVSSALPSPSVTWSQHTLPVTSVVVGAGGCEARVCSSSLDKTVRIFHIPTGSSLAAISLPCPINTIALHPCDSFLYCGGADGVIYGVDLCAPIASAGGSASFRIPQKLAGHTAAILCLTFSVEGNLIVSGSRDGTAKVWDCSSGQPLKTFAGHSGPVNFVQVMLRPPELIDGSHLKCSTSFASLAKRHEIDDEGTQGFAGPNRMFQVMMQPACSLASHQHESLPLEIPTEVGVAAASSSSYSGSSSEWKELAMSMHKFVVGRLLDSSSEEV